MATAGPPPLAFLGPFLRKGNTRPKIAGQLPGEAQPALDVPAWHVRGRARLQVRYLLGLRQPQPELPPGPEFVLVAKQEAHLRAGITGGKRRAVAVVPAGRLPPATVSPRGHAGLRTSPEPTGSARAEVEVRGRDFLHLVPPPGFPGDPRPQGC